MTHYGQYSQQATPQAPWHLWGGSVNWNLEGALPTGALTSTTTASQIVKIDYRRPETWGFWFSARILSHTVQVETKSVAVCFDVITGVGRSSFDTRIPSPPLAPGQIPPAFCRFRWIINPGSSVGPADRKYTTVVRGTVLDDSADPPDDQFGFFIDRIVGQDIQVMATLIVDSFDAVGVNRLSVEAQSYWAPLSHIRPDWFSEAFMGEEKGGT